MTAEIDAGAARAEDRRALLREIEREVRETAPWTGVPALSPAVRQALAHVPRHEFVAEAESAAAYANVPLPIGLGQTISQPYIVAIMTELAQIGADDVVLEVGSGCGYQTAVLAEIARRVYSVELLPELAESARARLARLGYANVELRCGDGALGWSEHAPFAAILVTAAARGTPPALLEQLAPGGRLVLPLVTATWQQMLSVVEKRPDGRLDTRELLPVAFVPLRNEGT